MPQATGSNARRGSFPDEVKDAVTPRATLLVLGVLALQLLFIASYVGAPHDPEPRDVPFGVVAPPAAAGQAVARLERLPGSPLDPRPVAGEARAREQIADRDIDGALIVDPAGNTDTARRLRRRHRPRHHPGEHRRPAGAGRGAHGADRRRGPDVRAGLRRAVVLLPGRGLCVGGYLCASILAISTGARPADPRRTRQAVRLALPPGTGTWTARSVAHFGTPYPPGVRTRSS